MTIQTKPPSKGYDKGYDMIDWDDGSEPELLESIDIIFKVEIADGKAVIKPERGSNEKTKG